MVLSELALQSVHFIISIHSLLWNWIVVTLQYLLFKSVKGDVTTCGGDVNPPPKQPHHVGLVLVEDHIDLKEVAKVVGWCVSSGIACISVYDRSGYCKKNKSILEENVKELGHSKRHPEDALTPLRNNNAAPQNGVAGHTADLQLHVLSAEDGRQALVGVARQFSADVAHNRKRIADITPESIDHSLRERLCIPDPELVLQFGQTTCLMGFLPWQCRLTEILSHPSHRKIDHHTFNTLLQSYVHTEQRFGK